MVINSNFQLQMSNCSDIDSSSCCDSNGELTVPSSYRSEMHDCTADESLPSSHGSEVQDCRKRPRQLQIQGSSWALFAHITVDQRRADSDWLTAGSEGDVENEERTAKINANLPSLFGAQFQIIFGKLRENVSYFVIFCNLLNILDVKLGTDSNDAAEIKIKNKVFCNLNNLGQ